MGRGLFDSILKKVHFYLKDYPDSDSAYRACVDAAEGKEVIRDYKEKSFFYYVIT
ncbi:MAG: hypothetical protein LiPW41_541 [Parcubacteria group bacterium LiPW_41]|nr:MAG: hypothetical protein LiPW41_541 [Parcubacteria group bacterium LiPW_41]